MRKIKILLKDERGYLMLNVIFLTLITSFAAMILLNAAPRVKNPHSTLRLTALYLADEQFAQLESMAAAGEPLTTNFLGKMEDLKSENSATGKPTEFKVETTISGDSNLREVTVTVKWTVDEKDFEIKSERTIWLVEK